MALKGIGIYAATILFTRLYGLRSFSKMSSFDFAMTVAIGSILASTVIMSTRTVLHGIVALMVLYGLQYLVAIARKNHRAIEKTLDNRPMLLMRNGELLRQNMAAAQVTEDDLYAKLRENNVLRLKDAKAVVMETNGQISVLSSTNADLDVEPELLHNVAGKNN